MKHMKTFAVIALFFAVNILSAQSAPALAKNWNELKNVQEVSWRVNLNLENNNTAAASQFTSVLVDVTQKLVASKIPTAYAATVNQQALAKLMAKAEELNKNAISKAAAPTLKQSYSDFKAILDSFKEGAAK
jgi:hypothetical protein